jgi:hypothetical protein
VLTNEHAISYKPGAPVRQLLVEPLQDLLGTNLNAFETTWGSSQQEPIRTSPARTRRSPAAAWPAPGGGKRAAHQRAPVGGHACFSGRRRAGRPRQLKEEQLQPDPSASASSTRVCHRSWTTMPLQFFWIRILLAPKSVSISGQLFQEAVGEQYVRLWFSCISLPFLAVSRGSSWRCGFRSDLHCCLCPCTTRLYWVKALRRSPPCHQYGQLPA